MESEPHDDTHYPNLTDRKVPVSPGGRSEELFKAYKYRFRGENAARIFTGATAGKAPVTFEGLFPKRDPRSNDNTLRARSITGTFDECQQTLLDWQQEGRNIYIRVNEGGPTKDTIIRIRAISIEFDAPEPHHRQSQALPERWHVTPSLIVRRGLSVQVHWLVGDCPVDRADALQRRLQKSYGSDPKAVGRQRLWRTPGFPHAEYPTQDVELYVSDHAWNRGTYSCAELEAGLPEGPAEPVKAQQSQSEKSDRRDVTQAQIRDMLEFINPTFDGNAPANFDAKKFGGEFGWGMDEWAGFARMLWNDEIPYVGERAEGDSGPTLCFDWSSGNLWQERTGEVIKTSCPDSMEALEARLSGDTVSNGYTVATIIKLARACGYKGPVGVPRADDFEIGSDIELAQHLVADLEQEHDSTVIHSEGAFYYYDGTRWAEIAENDLRRKVHCYDGKRHGENHSLIRLTQSRVSSILHEAAAMIERQGFFDDAAIGINCKSGFITFDNEGRPTLSPHDSDYRARHVIQAEWLPDFDVWWEGVLLCELLFGCFRGDADKRQRIELVGEICGAVAMGLAPWSLKQPKAFVLYGKHANNGKNQILDMIRGLVPQEATTSINPSQFDVDAYRVKLRGKLLNTASELGTARTIAAEMFKYVVTGDPMTVNVKYKDAVEFRARAVHMFATNVLPPFQGGLDRGVRRRLCPMELNRVFEQHEMIEGIGQRVAVEEADSLLAFAVSGASRLLKQGKYTEPLSCAAALREWSLTSDPVLAWIECRTEEAVGYRTPQRDLFNDFVRWALREGYDQQHLPKINNFIARIQSCDQKFETHRVGKGGSGGRVLWGLKLRPDEVIERAGSQFVEQELEPL